MQTEARNALALLGINTPLEVRLAKRLDLFTPPSPRGVQQRVCLFCFFRWSSASPGLSACVLARRERQTRRCRKSASLPRRKVFRGRRMFFRDKSKQAKSRARFQTRRFLLQVRVAALAVAKASTGEALAGEEKASPFLWTSANPQPRASLEEREERR